MKNNITRAAKFLPVLVAAGCGTAPALQQVATPAVKTQAAASSTAAKGELTSKVAELGAKAAYARLRSSTGIVQKGGRAWLDLDVWSTDKKIKSYEARWYATEGMLDRWITRDSGYNGWWAPFNPFSTYSYIQTRVHVDFEDGTDADGTLQLSIWVTQ